MSFKSKLLDPHSIPQMQDNPWQAFMTAYSKYSQPPSKYEDHHLTVCHAVVTQTYLT
jgi:hypothetical protein